MLNHSLKKKGRKLKISLSFFLSVILATCVVLHQDLSPMETVAHRTPVPGPQMVGKLRKGLLHP